MAGHSGHIEVTPGDVADVVSGRALARLRRIRSAAQQLLDSQYAQPLEWTAAAGWVCRYCTATRDVDWSHSVAPPRIDPGLLDHDGDCPWQTLHDLLVEEATT